MNEEQIPKYKAAISERQSLLDRVLRKTRIDETTGCWNWIGAASSNGYGRVKFEGRLALPHRVVCFCDGVVDDVFDKARTKVVMHSCDNPRCCNPYHITGGSMRENMEDCSFKGRSRNQHSRTTRIKYKMPRQRPPRAENLSLDVPMGHDEERG